MADTPHRLITAANGIHYIQAWDVATEADRLAIPYDAANVGKVCRVEESWLFYVLLGQSTIDSVLTTWWSVLNVEPAWRLPSQVRAYTNIDGEAGHAQLGTDIEYARADHVHNIYTGSPNSDGLAMQSEEGESQALARADHKHDASFLLGVVPYTLSIGAIVLANAHLRRYIRATAATDQTITIPVNLDLFAWPLNQGCSGIQIGSGRTQFVKGSGAVVLNGVGTYTRAPGSAWSLVRIGLNEYDLTGDLVES